MEEAIRLLRENNEMLKEILGIMKEISSPEHIQKEDEKALAINLLADVIVEVFGDKLREIVKGLNLKL